MIMILCGYARVRYEIKLSDSIARNQIRQPIDVLNNLWYHNYGDHASSQSLLKASINDLDSNQIPA